MWRIPKATAFSYLNGIDTSRTDYSARRSVRMHVVEVEYLRTLGVRLREGRGFQSRDARGAPRSVLANRTAAAMFWPGEAAVGRRVGLGMGPDDDWAEVVGVVDDVAYGPVDREVRPEFYVPYGEAMSPMSVHLFVRTHAEPAAQMLTVTVAVLGLSLVALVAGVVPAWRASRMDPMTVLRDA